MNLPSDDYASDRTWSGPVLRAGTICALLLCCCGALAADAKPPAFEGYTNPMSCLPGEEVEFHISTPLPKYSLDVIRIGAKDEVVWTKDDIPGGVLEVVNESGLPGNASMRGTGWPVTLKLRVGKNWKSGYYRVVLKGEPASPKSDEPFDPHKVITSRPSRLLMFFVVRSPNPGRDAKILLQLTTNTLQAYNGWGGSSLYSGPRYPRVSFNRPIIACPWSGSVYWAWPFIRWAETAGYKVDVCCNLDLELHPEMLPGYRLFVSVGHDEYWSAGMRDNLEKFIANGGNCAFFTGNTCCWQVRVEDEGRALVCHKREVEDDPVFKTGDYRNLTTLWSDPRLKRPENYLLGVGFPYGGYNGIFGKFMKGPGAGTYTVHRPDHWVFAGTGLKKGDLIGEKSRVAGYESDGCEFIVKDGLPVPTGRDGTPRNFTILATAPAEWSSGDHSIEWVKELRAALPHAAGQQIPEDHVNRTGAAVMGVYSRGGTVFNAASTDWAFGLVTRDPVVERIFRNVLDRLSK